MNLKKKVNLTKRQPKIDYTKRIGSPVDYRKGTHRRLDGKDGVKAQVIVGYDGRLYRWSEGFHTWVGASLADVYPNSAPDLRAQREVPVGWPQA